MRFLFDAPHADGIKVIPEIPDIALCLVEGRNGIGKTLAVRLLELISGEQPYAGSPSAWRSLPALGDMTVTVEGLTGGTTLRAELTPGTWSSDPVAVLDGDAFGGAYLDGEHASWAQVRALLQVRRTAGDESLSETLGQVLKERSTRAGTALKNLTPTVAMWDFALELCVCESA